MQHEERPETNEMVIHIALSAVFDINRRVRVSARATKTKPKDPPAARTTYRATHARDNPRSMLC
jgi:hypothetical protein